MELSNVEHCSQPQWKQAVNKAMKIKNRNDLLEIMARKSYKKIDLEELKSEKFELKPYMSKLDLNAARTKFAIRTKMTKTKLNYKNDPQTRIASGCVMTASLLTAKSTFCGALHMGT